MRWEEAMQLQINCNGWIGGKGPQCGLCDLCTATLEPLGERRGGLCHQGCNATWPLLISLGFPILKYSWNRTKRNSTSRNKLVFVSILLSISAFPGPSLRSMRPGWMNCRKLCHKGWKNLKKYVYLWTPLPHHLSLSSPSLLSSSLEGFTWTSL